jgi:predicted esterase
MATGRDMYKKGRLSAKPGKSAGSTEVPTGVQPLGFATEKDGFLYVPEGYTSSSPAALAVMLHGAGAPAEQGLSLLRGYADQRNMILVAPAAQSYTWDIIANDAFGPDVILIDQALTLAFENYAIDPAHVAIGGFSDGASYALSLGLTNGDVFTHIIAFSPGFAYTLDNRGKPAVFISHGIHDAVLPIDPCGRRIAPQLKRQGLQVTYSEFDGGHEIPACVSESAANWFAADEAV